MLQITPQIYLLLKTLEGCRTQAYFCPAGIATIGIGTTRYRNGDPVRIGDEITEDEAELELFNYMRDKVEPALNKHFAGLPLQPLQRDALASFMFNLGPNGRKWPTLKRLICEQAGDEAISDQWMKYHNAGGKPSLGLYRRRLLEVMMWHGIAWDDAYEDAWSANITADWRSYVDWQAESKTFFDDPDLVIPVRGADPTPDTPMTMDDAQYLGAQTAGFTGTFGDFVAHRSAVRQKHVISVPHVDVNQPPKRMEDSKTHKGLSKADSGREGLTAGAVITSGATVLAAVEGGTVAAERTLDAAGRANNLIFGLSAGDIITVGIVIGLPLIVWGGWRWYAGRMLAYEGRQEGTQVKV